MIVVDASAIVALVLNSPGDRATAIRLRLAGESLHVPHLLDLEVAHVLRRMLQSGDLAADRATAAVARVVSLRATRYPHRSLLGRIWRLRENLTAYDAVYVALAETLGVPVLTLDAALARAPGHYATIELL